MIVDLLGFGGTGKTTVKNKILINVKSHSSAITEYERPNFGNIKSMLKWGLFVLSTPSTLIKAYKLLKFLKKQRRGFTYFETLKRITLYANTAFRDSRIYLSDEGLSIYLQHFDLREIDQNLESLLPDAIISIYIDENERRFRLYKRGGEALTRFRHRDNERISVLQTEIAIFNHYKDVRIYEHLQRLNSASFLPPFSESELLSLYHQNKAVQVDVEKHVNKRQIHDKFLENLRSRNVKVLRFRVNNLEEGEIAVAESTAFILEHLQSNATIQK